MVFAHGRGFGRGFGHRGGTGFGFRGAAPAWPYIGRGRGGLPRCWYPGLWEPPVAVPPPEDQLGILKDQADLMKRQLEEVEQRI